MQMECIQRSTEIKKSLLQHTWYSIFCMGKLHENQGPTGPLFSSALKNTLPVTVADPQPDSAL